MTALTPAPTKTVRSLLGADGLRALACLMVIFHHLSQQLIFNPQIHAPLWLHHLAEFLITGQTGVSVFFVLSGFLLSTPFWDAYLERKGMPDLRVYAMRRAGRIMPGFYVNLLFCLVLSLFFTPHAPALIWRYFAGLTFTAGFHWMTLFPAEYNGPLWSIGFEVVSYVLMPLGMVGLFGLLGRRGRPGLGLLWWVLVWAAVVALNQLVLSIPVESIGRSWQYGMVGGAKFWMPRYNPLGLFGHFSLGILAAGASAALARTKWNERTTVFDIAAGVLLAGWVALLASQTGRDDFSMTWQGPYYFPYFPALTAALLACLTRSRVAGRLMDNAFFRYTSRISFGLYLWHYLVIAAFSGAIGDLGEWLMLVVLSLAFSYVIATASWKYWEEPWLRRAQKWKPGTPIKPKTLWFAAAAVAVLVALPAGLTTLVRPSAWQLPVPAGVYATLTEPGPVTGVLADPDGTLYVAKNGRDVYRIAPNREAQRIAVVAGPWAEVRLKYRQDNTYWLPDADPYASVIRQGTFIWNLRRGPDGLLYAAAADRIVVLTAEGSIVRTVPMPYLGEFGVMDVAFDRQGALFASDGTAIFRVGEHGVEEAWDSGSLAKTGLAGVQTAAGLAFSADGSRLYLADYHGFDRDQARILEFPVINGLLQTPKAIRASGALFAARSEAGGVWFSSGFSGRLWAVKNDSVSSVTAFYLDQAGALAFGGGRLYAACWNGAVGEIALGETPSFH
jgi:peptidoglycan/LPS O-acetylase OafA/YrhL